MSKWVLVLGGLVLITAGFLTGIYFSAGADTSAKTGPVNGAPTTVPAKPSTVDPQLLAKYTKEIAVGMAFFTHAPTIHAPYFAEAKALNEKGNIGRKY